MEAALTLGGAEPSKGVCDVRSRAKRGNQSKVGSIRRSAAFFVTLADPDPGFSLRMTDGRTVACTAAVFHARSAGWRFRNSRKIGSLTRFEVDCLAFQIRVVSGIRGFAFDVAFFDVAKIRPWRALDLNCVTILSL